jgi:hypothetical protein
LRRMLATSLLLALALGQLGGSCGGGNGSGGSRSVIDVSSAPSGAGGPPIACAPLPGQFPAGLSLVPGEPGRLVVSNFTPSAVLPFDANTSPPVIASAGSVPSIPPDSDGDGKDEGCSPPACDSTSVPFMGVPLGVQPGLALVAASGYEEILFADADRGTLLSFDVGTPAGFPASRFPFLPAPGATAARTAVSTAACVAPPPGAVDSTGAVPNASPACPAGQMETSFTAGAALAAGRLFVPTSNITFNASTFASVFQPGTVLVYDIDLSALPPQVSPDAAQPVIFTHGFNPTGVTTVRTPGGRELVLVTVSGALAFTASGAQVAQSDAAVEVIDPAAPALVGRVPLGLAGLASGPLAVDPTGRVAFSGSSVGRSLYGIDLAALDAIPAAPASPVVLDGSDAAAGNADARIFDAAHPLVLPQRPGGLPDASCPGFTSSAAFNAAADRLFATEYCDGSIGVVSVDLSAGPVPLPASRFTALHATPVGAPIGDTSSSAVRAPSALAVRPGVPGLDFSGADLFFLAGTPQGELCAVSSDAL